MTMTYVFVCMSYALMHRSILTLSLVTCLYLFLSRAIQILPNKLITVVGQHSVDYAVDNLCLSHGGQYLVSGSYDKVSFWPAEEIPKLYLKNLKSTDEDTDSSDASDGDKESKKRKRRRKHRNIQKQTAKPRKLKQKSDFFADL